MQHEINSLKYSKSILLQKNNYYGFKMKNKIQEIIITFFLFAIISSFCYGQNKSDFGLSIRTISTVRDGTQDESVYFQINDNDVRLLSYLEWEQKPIVLMGLEATASYKNFYLTSSAVGALKSNCGTVTDSDYMNVSTFFDCPDEFAGIKTNYTESVCSLDSYYSFTASASYKFNFDSVFSLSPVAKFDYTYSSFYAVGCEGKYNDAKVQDNGYYGEWDGDGYYTISLSGNVLRLQRNSYTTWLGFTADNQINKLIDLSFNFALCPFIYVESLDSHLMRSLYFLDRMYGVFNGVQVGSTLKFSPTQKFLFYISGNFNFIGKMYGSDYYSANKLAYYKNSSFTDGTNYYNVTSGSSSSSFEISAGIQIRFF